MRIYFMLLATLFLTLSLAFAQENQNLSNLNVTIQNATSISAGPIANLIGLKSSSIKPTYDVESFAKIKPVRDMSTLSRIVKPVFDVSQRAGQPANFSYTMGVMKPTFNVSQRGGQLTRFTYNMGIMKPIYNVSAYSTIKPLYDIEQFSRIKPVYHLP